MATYSLLSLRLGFYHLVLVIHSSTAALAFGHLRTRRTSSSSFPMKPFSSAVMTTVLSVRRVPAIFLLTLAMRVNVQSGSLGPVFCTARHYKKARYASCIVIFSFHLLTRNVQSVNTNSEHDRMADRDNGASAEHLPGLQSPVRRASAADLSLDGVSTLSAFTASESSEVADVSCVSTAMAVFPLEKLCAWRNAISHNFQCDTLTVRVKGDSPEAVGSGLLSIFAHLVRFPREATRPSLELPPGLTYVQAARIVDFFQTDPGDVVYHA